MSNSPEFTKDNHKAQVEAAREELVAELSSIQAEYDSLAERWHYAHAGSQEIANLHATFKARAQGVGSLIEKGLFKRILAALAPPAPAASSDALDLRLLDWAVSRWQDEVKNRPLVNVHRRSFDDTWRQVIRFAGGAPDELIGPSHDALLAAIKGEQKHDR